MEQENTCYICFHKHKVGDSIVEHYIKNHIEEVIVWKQLFDNSMKVLQNKVGNKTK